MSQRLEHAATLSSADCASDWPSRIEDSPLRSGISREGQISSRGLKFSYAAAFLAMVLAPQAQKTVMMNGPNNILVGRNIAAIHGQTISMNFQVSVPAAATAAPSDLTKAMAGATQSLYDIVDRQYDILSVALKGSYRLMQINVGDNINNRANSGAPTISSNAMFEIDLSAPAAVPQQK
jgi:hypothetical protein